MIAARKEAPSLLPYGRDFALHDSLFTASRIAAIDSAPSGTLCPPRDDPGPPVRKDSSFP